MLLLSGCAQILESLFPILHVFCFGLVVSLFCFVVLVTEYLPPLFTDIIFLLLIVPDVSGLV